MMLGLLLARAGVRVTVLEKHADFLRDFRGDTIHPSTLELMAELGLLPALLARPHQQVRELRGVFDGFEVTLADFRSLPVRAPFIALMPQWDFLDFLAEHARAYPSFELILEAEITDLLLDSDRARCVRARTAQGPLEVHADLTVGADGRKSTVRSLAGLKVHEMGAPIDVLWMRLSRRDDDPAFPLGRVHDGRILVMIYRGDYWQCGFLIAKGKSEELMARGIEAFRSEVASVAPFLAERVHELRTWDDVKLLTVAVDRLERWYRPGLLCIGDAAHAMSPIGGVGINLAIQDAVAAANELIEPLRRGSVALHHLRAIQRRRELPTRLTQRAQVFLQEHVIRPRLGAPPRSEPPWPLLLLDRWPRLRRVPAHMIGIGVRPERLRRSGPDGEAGAQSESRAARKMST